MSKSMIFEVPDDNQKQFWPTEKKIRHYANVNNLVERLNVAFNHVFDAINEVTAIGTALAAEFETQETQDQLLKDYAEWKAEMWKSSNWIRTLINHNRDWMRMESEGFARHLEEVIRGQYTEELRTENQVLKLVLNEINMALGKAQNPDDEVF